MNDLRAMYGPEVREIGLNRGGVAAHEDAQNDQRYQSASVFADVKMFWIYLPQPQSARIRSGEQQRSAKSRPVAARKGSPHISRRRVWAATIQAVGETAGTSTPRKRANATATAAMVPV